MRDEQPQSGSGRSEERGGAPLTMLAFEFALIPLAGLLGVWLGHSPVCSIVEGEAGWRDDVAAAGWGAIAALPPLVGLWWSQRSTWKPLQDLHQLTQSLLAPHFLRSSTGELALLALVAGLGEELLFRGLLQERLTEWVLERPGGLSSSQAASSATAILATSLGFGLLHALSRTYFLLATAMSVYLGVLHAAVGNVLAPVAAHAIYDFVALVYFVRITTASLDEGVKQ